MDELDRDDLIEVVRQQQAQLDALTSQLSDLAARFDEQRVMRRHRSSADGEMQGDGHPALDAGPRQSDRRAFFRTGAAAAAGAVGAGALLDVIGAAPAGAANGASLVLGSSANQATSGTGLEVDGTTKGFGIGVTDNGLGSLPAGVGAAVFGHANGTAFQQGVCGFAGTGGSVAVYGLCNSQGDAVRGDAAVGYGVHGTSPTAGVYGAGQGGAGHGVRGYSAGYIGVRGESDGVIGVYGSCPTGSGVVGGSSSGVGGVFSGGRSALTLQAGPSAAPPQAGLAQAVGSLTVDAAGNLWFCTASGTPGTWRKVAGPATAGALHVLAAPARIYDSRPFPPANNGPKGTLGANQTRAVDCSYNGAVPAGAVAVMVNIIVIAASTTGFLAAYSNAVSWPGNSSVNWDHTGETVAVTTVSAVDAAARFAVKASNPTDFAVDVIGYYA